MKKRFLYSSIACLISMVAACLINLLVSAMAVKIVNLFIVVDYFEAAIVNSIVAAVVVPCIVGTIHFYEAYKTAEFKPLYILGTVAIGGIVHMVLSTLLMFYPFIAGGTRYLAGLINFGSGFNSTNKVTEVYLWAYLLSFTIYLIAELGISLLFGMIGKRKRLKIRNELLHSQTYNQ